MADYREYNERVSVTASELNTLVRLQQVSVDATRNKSDQNWIRNQLEQIAGNMTVLLALAFANSTPVGVATGLATLFAQALADNYFLNAITNGLEKTSRHSSWFNVNTNKYKRIEFEASFVEYSYAGGRVRFLTQAGPIDRMQRLDGTWISAS